MLNYLLDVSNADYFLITYAYFINYFFFTQVSELIKKRKQKYNFDNRLTGSNIIDEELQLILYYIFRDFIYPW